MPLIVLGNVSPYEKLYGQSPNLDHLRAFGCLCYITTSRVHRTKFDPKAQPCVFTSYSPSQKAYKVLNLHTKQTVISIDIQFHEKHFPCHHSTDPSSTPFQFFLPTHSNSHIFVHPFIYEDFIPSVSYPKKTIEHTHPAT